MFKSHLKADCSQIPLKPIKLLKRKDIPPKSLLLALNVASISNFKTYPPQFVFLKDLEPLDYALQSTPMKMFLNLPPLFSGRIYHSLFCPLPSQCEFHVLMTNQALCLMIYPLRHPFQHEATLLYIDCQYINKVEFQMNFCWYRCTYGSNPPPSN